MNIRILFGTESGGGEMTAEDIAGALESQHDVTVEDMENADVNSLNSEEFYIIICSSYGEGDLPFSAKPFSEALESTKPDLNGVHYAILGRGDTSYLKTFMAGSQKIDAQLSGLGATRVGDFAQLDASKWDIDEEEYSVEWATSALAAYESQAKVGS